MSTRLIPALTKLRLAVKRAQPKTEIAEDPSVIGYWARLSGLPCPVVPEEIKWVPGLMSIKGWTRAADERAQLKKAAEGWHEAAAEAK